MKSRSSASLSKNIAAPQKAKKADVPAVVKPVSFVTAAPKPKVARPPASSTATTSVPASSNVSNNTSVLLRCADGFGLNDNSCHDGYAPHPHRPALRSLKTDDDVLRARIGALGKAILHATPAPSLSVNMGSAPQAIPQSTTTGSVRNNTTKASRTSGTTALIPAIKPEVTAPAKKIAPAYSASAVSKVDSILNSSVGASGGGVVISGSKFLNPKPVILTESMEKKAAQETSVPDAEAEGRRSPIRESNTTSEATVRFIDPESGCRLQDDTGVSKSTVGATTQKISKDEVGIDNTDAIKVSVDSFKGNTSHKPLSSRANSFTSASVNDRNSTASTFSTDNPALHSCPSDSFVPRAFGTLAEQQRVEEVERRASEVMAQRQDGPGVLLASSAAPLYDLSYASYLGKNTMKAKRNTPEGKGGDSSGLPNAVILDTLGGTSFSTLSHVAQRQTMTVEEVANTLYLAARASRTSVDRNYYQVVHILWQSPMTGRGIYTARTNGDPLPTGASTHRRRRLEPRFLRDLYTRMPLTSPLANVSSTARGLTSRAVADTPPYHDIMKPDSTAARAQDEIRFSFLLRFELILVSSGDMFPGKLIAPRGRFDVSMDPLPDSEKDGADCLGDFSTTPPPVTARYADQCMDWRPLYPRLVGVHVQLPSKLIHANPHLMDYAAILDGAIRPYHDRGGVVDDDLPERISFHVILAPSSVSSALLPTIANVTSCYSGRSPPVNPVAGSLSSAATQGSISSAAKADVLVMDTQANPSQELIVVSASAHRHIRRRTLFGSGTVTSPHHKLHAVIYLNVQARRLSLNRSATGLQENPSKKRTMEKKVAAAGTRKPQ